MAFTGDYECDMCGNMTYDEKNYRADVLPEHWYTLMRGTSQVHFCGSKCLAKQAKALKRWDKTAGNLTNARS